MLTIFFNFRALLAQQPNPEVPPEKRDPLWLTEDNKDPVMTPEIYRQHLTTQRDMEAMVADMRRKNDPIAQRPVTYHRHNNGRTGTISFY